MPEARRKVSQLTRDVARLKARLPEGPPTVMRPVMVATIGLPGSGKSYFSRRLASQVPLLVLESDYLRKVLFSDPSHTTAESTRLFDACHALIADLLNQGKSVLLDATNLIEGHREHLYYIAEQAGVKLVLVQLKASPEVVYERLRVRSERTDPEDRSRADWRVHQKMASTTDPIRRNHFVVDTSGDITPAIALVVREIRRSMRPAG